MLVGQQSGGDEHRHLTVIFHGLEGRPHGHFRFSVPDVAAHQSVHRFAGLHVVRNVFDRFELIRRFFVLKRGLELVVHRAVESIGVACHEFTVGIEVDQLVGHLLDVLLHARGRFGPTGAAQTFKARRMAVRSAIPLHMVEPLQRDVQRVAAGEFQDQIIAVELLHREAFEALIFCDAMLDMDDIVAHVEIFQRGEEGRGFTLGLRFVARAFGKQFLFRQDGQAQVRCEESSGQIAVQDVKRRFGLTGSGPGFRSPFRRRHIVFA